MGLLRLGLAAGVLRAPGAPPGADDRLLPTTGRTVRVLWSAVAAADLGHEPVRSLGLAAGVLWSAGAAPGAEDAHLLLPGRAARVLWPAVAAADLGHELLLRL